MPTRTGGGVIGGLICCVLARLQFPSRPDGKHMVDQSEFVDEANLDFLLAEKTRSDLRNCGSAKVATATENCCLAATHRSPQSPTTTASGRR
jgi:hypothetical protein